MREALIVWDGWIGHEPEQCAAIVKDMLEGEGFSVAVETATSVFASEAMYDFSLVVPIITMSKIEKDEVAPAHRAQLRGVSALLDGCAAKVTSQLRKTMAVQCL